MTPPGFDNLYEYYRKPENCASAGKYGSQRWREICQLHKIVRRTRRVAKLTRARRQSCVQPIQSGETSIPNAGDPFQPGAMLLLTLGNPREKFWGAILALTVQGISLSGIELGSFEDLVSMIKAGDAPSFGVVFFPMHRIERGELDSSIGNIPSLSERFTAKTGLDPASVLTRHLQQLSGRSDI